ncbi:MAG: P1 family peptidase [Dongiaceae bacterium]
MIGQQDLVPRTRRDGRSLALDFPSLHIGVAEYDEGPTGATVFWFPDRAIGAVDVRGGAPGAYNLDWLRLGYDFPNLDAITIAGGSWYGLGASAGVAAALKDRGHRSGHWANLANVAGAIIYDYGTRRLTPYHPDDRLGRAALEAAAPGAFPLGARGAGRHTMQGSYFGLWLHSGQGGACRSLGPTRIACFSVVNAVGVVADHDGNVACGTQRMAAAERRVADLIALVPDKVRTQTGSIMGVRTEMNPANTTISLVVTNQKLNFAQLQRLAIQVHTSMGRCIQPLGTVNDGDILFAVSTAEIDNPALHPTDLATVASEVMWSAVLASVPEIVVPADDAPPLPAERLPGRFTFAPGVGLEVRADPAGLALRIAADRDIFGLPPGTELKATGRRANGFSVGKAFLDEIRFQADESGAIRLVLNPGPWQQIGTLG